MLSRTRTLLALSGSKPCADPIGVHGHGRRDWLTRIL
jgi:hypothetical protein